MTLDDINGMPLGQVVDYCIDYNKRQEQAERQAKREEKHGRKRKATQNDINAFFG